MTFLLQVVGKIHLMPENTVKQVVNLHWTKQSFPGDMDSVLYRCVYLPKHNISLQQNTALPYHNRIDLDTCMWCHNNTLHKFQIMINTICIWYRNG